jgi:hypothetical protein
MGKGRGSVEEGGKRRAVEGAGGKGHRQQKELMGKGRVCAEKNGKRKAVGGVEGKRHRQ